MNDSGADSAEALDPRVQIELEHLNSATDEINRLEVELDEARLGFRRLLAEGHLRFQQLTKKLGTSVHKARPYYEARFRVNITSQELHTANLAYDKANSAHSAAREMVYLAEQGLSRLAAGPGGVTLDPAWQEMLNHATARVNQAEADRASAALTQRARAATHRAASTLVAQLQGSLKRHITKSRPYFEEKARINSSLEAQKARIQSLERQVAESKQRYSGALRALERISDEIHTLRSEHGPRNGDLFKDRKSQPASEDTSPDANIEDIIQQSTVENVREWLRRADRSDDNWTEIELDYSSPEEVSFDKCSLSLPRASAPPPPFSTPPSPRSPPPSPSRASRTSPRRYIPAGAAAAAAGTRRELLKAELGRRPSLDAILYDTGEKVKEMFQGFSLFGERRGSESAPRSPRSQRSPARNGSIASDERYSDTESLASMEMLTDEQIASLMLDAQLEAVCERLVGVGVGRPPTSPQGAPNGHHA